jgi:hypothetical protein
MHPANGKKAGHAITCIREGRNENTYMASNDLLGMPIIHVG